MEKFKSVSLVIIKNVLLPICVGLLLAFILRHTVMFVAYIPSSSMEPTLNVGDRLLTNRLAYTFGDVKRFDVVVFKQEESDMVMIKRVIGLPNERIKCSDNVIYINDEPIEQDFLEDGVWTSDFEETTIPDDSYFMLGDNRMISLDSRFWANPFVKKSEIWGKPFFKVKSGKE